MSPAPQLFVHAEERAPRHEHRTRRHAHRALHRSHAIRPRERRPALHKPVEIRCADARIPQRRDRVRPLIVAEEEEDIRLLRRSGNGREQQCGEEGERVHHGIKG